MESNYQRLIATLRECFMLDQADLDFGIYRIMNSRRTEIETFLEKDLIPQVKTVLESAGTSDKWSLEKELHDAIANAKALGADPESLPKVRELREKIANSSDLTALENEVFSHLTSFFRRYFDAGDFISMRRYKKDVYAIPYEWEEVKLHWANADQYYIKTSEFFKNYRFKTESGKSVVFTLVEASTEQNNNKAQWDKERKFKIYTPSPSSIEQGKPAHTIEEKDGELHVYFMYEPMDKWVKQDALITEAFKTIRDAIPNEYAECLSLSPTEKDKSRTLIQRHINDYVKRNTFDYFIHKDLSGFLTRELDFYIKNEILYIDDIDTRSPETFIASLAMIKAVKQIGEKIITFLSSLEEFQKKLFLKKKMVVETGYCITIDRIDEAYYDDIRTNEAQIDEWISLFAIDEIDGFSRPLSREFLQNNPYLVLDTKYFDESWKNKLIGEISENHNLDEWLDGLMINSENFQALNLLQERYREQVKCIYIDPPYNAQSSEIVYKNTFKHSSWLSLMDWRIDLWKRLERKDWVLVIAIDEVEQEVLWRLLTQHFPEHEKSCIAVNHNPSWQQWDNFSFTHEYAYFTYPKPWRYISEQLRENEKEWDERNFRDVTWDDSLRTAWANCFYPIYIKDDQVIWFWDVCDNNYHPPINVSMEDWVIAVYPVDPEWIERKWRFARQTVEAIKHELLAHHLSKRWVIDIKRIKKTFNFKSNWVDSRYSANNHGTQLLNNVIKKAPFSYPKSIYLVQDSIIAWTYWKKDWLILDFFAWSGTTWHAVINLNREDAKDGGEMGKKKYILVEMGEYFNTVTKPRIQKVIYSEDWKDGKPVSRKGSSHAFKYLRLESYEDALNNLKLQRSETQQWVLFAPENAEFREDYMLQYMLDTESQGSILSVDHFAHPFDFEMRITRDNETRVTRVDLVETFNYLIGLVVEHTYEARGYRVVKWCTLEWEKILIVWRDIAKHSNEDLNSFLQKSAYNPNDTEFDRIYVNGDNTIENKPGEQLWKVMLIEEEFKKKMFEI